jgi:hypothetical protein
MAALLALTIGMTLLMNWVGAPLITPAAPGGVVSYELAGSRAQAEAILSSWDGEARLFAAFGLGLDYLYMPLYAACFSLAVQLSGQAMQRRGWKLGRLARLLGPGMWLAAVFDAIENLGLTVMLFGMPSQAWALSSAVCAGLKFGLLLAGLVFVVIELLARLFWRL